LNLTIILAHRGNDATGTARLGSHISGTATGRAIKSRASVRQFYYDWAAACKDARRDGWNAEPYDAPNRIARAVEADFQFLSAFINNDWHYVGVIVELLDDDGEVLSDTSLWGVETWKDNHCEVAHDLARELSAQHDAEQEQTAVESFEAHYWATRDVVTLGAGV
jgi:hypothetical protein